MLTRLMFGGGGYCAGVNNASWFTVCNIWKILLWV